jgi:hypothetical protein
MPMVEDRPAHWTGLRTSLDHSTPRVKTGSFKNRGGPYIARPLDLGW